MALLLLLATAGAAGAASGVGNSGDGWFKLDCSAESPLTAVKDICGNGKGELAAQYGRFTQSAKRSMVVHANAQGRSLHRTVVVGDRVHRGHRDLIINEVSIVETESGRAQPDGQPARKRIANRQSWRLEFDGNHYVLPAALSSVP